MFFDNTAYAIYMILLLALVAWPVRRYLKTIAGTDAKSYLMKLRGKELKSFEFSTGEYIPVEGADGALAAQKVNELNLYIDEYTLTINKPYKLKGAADVNELVGRKVTSTFQYMNFVTITFGYT